MPGIEGSQPGKSTAFDWPPGTAYQINKLPTIPLCEPPASADTSLVLVSLIFNTLHIPWPPLSRPKQGREADSGGIQAVTAGRVSAATGKGWGWEVGWSGWDLDIRRRAEGADSASTPCCLYRRCLGKGRGQVMTYMRCGRTVIIDLIADLWVTSKVHHIPGLTPAECNKLRNWDFPHVNLGCTLICP